MLFPFLSLQRNARQKECSYYIITICLFLLLFVQKMQLFAHLEPITKPNSPKMNPHESHMNIQLILSKEYSNKAGNVLHGSQVTGGQEASWLHKNCGLLSQFQQTLYRQMLKAVKDVLVRIWEIQDLKVRKNGVLNMAIGYILLISYFYYVPNFAKSIWPEQIEDKATFQLLATSITVTASVLIFSLIFLPGYLGVKAYKKYQTQPSLKRPWEKDNWDYMKWRTLKYVIINQLVVFPLYIYVGLITVGVSFTFDEFPTHWQLVKTIGLAMVADDFLYMWIHRLMHHPSIYRFHKMHHEYDSVMSYMSQYCHPVQQLVGNILPSTIIFSVYRVHIFVFIFWQTYKVFNTIEGHSGYRLPWIPTRVHPLVYGSGYHDFHHSKNMGNYATSFYLFQLILGTNKLFFDRELAEYRKSIKPQ